MKRRPTFLYDSDCGPCARFQSAVSLLDPSKAVNFVPITEAASAGMLESVEPSLRFSSSRMIDSSGKMTAGGDALVALFDKLPPSRLAARLIVGLPFGRRVFRWFYGVLSRLHGTACRGGISGDIHLTDLSTAWSSP